MTFNIKKAAKYIGKKYSKNKNIYSKKEELEQEIQQIITQQKNLNNNTKNQQPIIMINSQNPNYNQPPQNYNPYQTQNIQNKNTQQKNNNNNNNQPQINYSQYSQQTQQNIDQPTQKKYQNQSTSNQPTQNFQTQQQFFNPNQFEQTKEKQNNELEEKIENINIDDLNIKTKRILKEDDKEELSKTNIKYPVTPSAPKDGEKVFAWASITWDKQKSSLVYKIIEPHIDPTDKKNINKIKQIIEEEINIDFKAFSKDSAQNYIKEQIKKIINRFGLMLSNEKLIIYEYYIIRDFIGFSKLQPILDDENIEDISCDGVNIPIFIYHRDPIFGSLESNIIFENHEELDNLVRTLAQRSGRNISMATPLLDGALPDGSRLQATLATDIAKKGSNFTIRRFSKIPLTPIHLLKYKSMSSKVLAYLWFAIEHSSSIFIVGSTASGKTSLLNALSLFIKPTDKIVSIEDTPEIRLPHEHWVQEISREGFGESNQEGTKLGEVSMFDLLKGSLRQRPDYIIVGEIRGSEASVLFQQMATGHPGISTFHADSLQKVVNRLITRPINLPPSLLESLDIIIIAKRLRYGDKYVRKSTELIEIKGINLDTNEIKSNTLFKWNADNDKHHLINESFLLGKISKNKGIQFDIIKKEIQNRIKVLEWMNDMYITHYQRVGAVIKAYYNNPEQVLDLIGYD
jgi:archaeal flagellar protein FlaI